jgi:hypothetical protein
MWSEGKEEGGEKETKKQPIPSCLMQKETVTALSVLDSII